MPWILSLAIGKQTTVYLCGFRAPTEAATTADPSTTVDDSNRVGIADVSYKIKQRTATDPSKSSMFDIVSAICR